MDFTMLGKLVAMIMTIPGEWLGVLYDVAVKLASQRGGEWGAELARFARREPCWVVVAPKMEEAKVYLHRLFTFKLQATKGQDTCATAREVFQAYLDPNFENLGVIFSGTVPETEVVVDELVEDGKFSKFLGNTAAELEKRRMLGNQFLSLCRDNSDRLRGGEFGNFFVLTKNDEPVAEDLSNVFVADVFMFDWGELLARLLRFQDGHVWSSDHERRVFSPQQ